MRQFAYGDSRLFGEDARHFLVRAPVGTADGVEEVQRRVVALGLDAVAERGLHAALCGTAVAAPWRDQRKNQNIVAGRGRLDGGTFAGQSAADDQYVGADE